MFKKWSKNTMILSIVAALAIVSPRDLIPDSIPILGQIDDLALATLVLCSAFTDLKRSRRDITIKKNESTLLVTKRIIK